MKYRITADITIEDDRWPNGGLRMSDIRDALDGGSAGGVTAYVDAVRSMEALIPNEERDKITARLQDVTADPADELTQVSEEMGQYPDREQLSSPAKPVTGQDLKAERLAMAIKGREWEAMSPDDRSAVHLQVLLALNKCRFVLYEE